MHVGVYGSGYLGTVVSACLADFGTPVTCCHPDSSRMVEMAQGNVPFFEKNLKEVIKRNVRCRTAGLFHRHGIVCPQSAGDLSGGRHAAASGRSGRPHRAPGARSLPFSTIMTPVPVGTATSAGESD